MFDRVRFHVKNLANLTTEVRARHAAPNLATHLPINTEIRGAIDLSQISSGQCVGRFGSIEDARAFAVVAVERFPALGRGDTLTPAEVDGLVALRKRHNGRRH